MMTEGNGVTTICGICGEPREKYAICKPCNRRRVYQWREANREKWRGIHNRSRRDRRAANREGRVCQRCGVSIAHRRVSARFCSDYCYSIVWRAERYKRRKVSITDTNKEDSR